MRSCLLGVIQPCSGPRQLYLNKNIEDYGKTRHSIGDPVLNIYFAPGSGQGGQAPDTCSLH